MTLTPDEIAEVRKRLYQNLERPTKNTNFELFMSRAHAGKEPSLRYILPDEIVIEFDHVKRDEGVALAKQTVEILTTAGFSGHLYDHGGKSPHIHLSIPGLQSLSDAERKVYKENFLQRYAADKERVDRSLCTSKHLIASEGLAHWKKNFLDRYPEAADYGVKNIINVFGKGGMNSVQPELCNKELNKSNKRTMEAPRSASIVTICQHYGVQFDKCKAKCPFHSDTDPSFVVYPETQSFYCFGCKEGGDAYSFVMKSDNCKFTEAKKKVYQILGLPLEPIQSIGTATGKPSANIDDLKISVLTALANKKPRAATEMMTKFFEENNTIYTLRQDEDYEMWIYKDGIYIPQAKTYIQEFCRSILTEAHSTHFGNEIIAKIAADTFVEPITFFNSDLNANEMCINNGILNIETKELKGYTPTKIFFNKIHVNYKAEATCPNFDKFLDEVLENPADKVVVYELIGNCLLRHYKFNKAAMLCGSGSNGKSILLQVIKQFLGPENCVAIPLQQLQEDIFALSELHKKFCNIAGEIPALKLETTNNFKQITGEDSISASRKFLSRLHFYSYCKQFFSANELPVTTDMTFAFFRRWILINFPHCFIPETEWDILKDDEKKIKKIADKNLIEKLTTPEEKSGILNEALRGVERLLTKKDFSTTTTNEDIKIKWIGKSDSFLSFCMQNIEKKYGEVISKEDLRQRYNEWCEKDCKKLMSDKHMRETLINIYGAWETYENTSTYGDGVTNTTRLRFWKGIQFKKLF